MKGLYWCLFLGLMACQTQSYAPKPKGYARLHLPPHTYQALPDSFPYFFEFSTQAQVLKDSSWMAEPYWIYVYYPDFQASIQITYKPIHGKRTLAEEYLSDAYKLIARHQVKAYAMQEHLLRVPIGQVSYTRLVGEVPTPIQFHATDSVDHFFRGAVYFDTATKNDSLAPVIEYLHEEVLHLLRTLRWRTENIAA